MPNLLVATIQKARRMQPYKDREDNSAKANTFNIEYTTMSGWKNDKLHKKAVLVLCIDTLRPLATTAITGRQFDHQSTLTYSEVNETGERCKSRCPSKIA